MSSFRRSTGETGSSSCRPRPSVDRSEGISLPSKEVESDSIPFETRIRRELPALLAENPAEQLLAQLGEPPYVKLLALMDSQPKLLAELLASLDAKPLADLLASLNEKTANALAELFQKP